MKLLVVFAFVLVVAMAQRPSYVSGPVGYPGLGSHFKVNGPTDRPAGNKRLQQNRYSTTKIPFNAFKDADSVNEHPEQIVTQDRANYWIQ